MNIINRAYSNSINICLASDANYMNYCFITILSIIKKRTTADNYDFIIITKEKQEKYQEIISKLINKEDKISIRFISADITATYFEKTRAYYTEAIFYRILLLTEAFEKYDKMIYLDCDTILMEDISVLWNTDLMNHPVAAIKDYSIEIQKIYETGIFYEKKMYNFSSYIKSALKLQRPEWYFNSGVMIFNLSECRKRQDLQKLNNILSEHKYFYPDQDALNIIYNRQILLLDTGWNYQNCYELYKTEKNPQIRKVYEDLKPVKINLIHYISSKKPWTKENTPLKEAYTELSIDYFENYNH